MSNKHVAPQLAGEFETILRAANADDPDVINWRFDGLDVAGITPGRFEPANQFWHPDRHEIIALARRTTELRTERWDGAHVRQPIEEWREVLQRKFGLRTDVGVGAGWRDLLTAALEISGNGPKVTQIKEKFGTMRSYGVGEIGLYADLLSGRICEVCGAPGTVRPRSWIVTRCDAHVRKSPWDS